MAQKNEEKPVDGERKSGPGFYPDKEGFIPSDIDQQPLMEILEQGLPQPIDESAPKEPLKKLPDPLGFAETGIFYDVLYDDYHSWAGLRKTNLFTLFQKTPAHYKWKCEHPDFDLDHFLVGHATHTAVLEPVKFRGAYILRPRTYIADRGKDEGQEKPWNSNALVCKQILADIKAMGKIVLKHEQYEEAQKMRDAVLKNEAAAMLINNAKKEVSIQWRDPHTELLCKARLDLWIENGGIMADLKTARNAAPAAFGRDAYGYGYAFQMAYYFDGIKQLTGVDMSPPVLIAVEKEEPYLVACYEVEEDAMMMGRCQYKETLRSVRKCLETGVWPGYSNGLMSLVLPSYAGLEIYAGD